jgi:hypothetical protein
MAEKKKPVGTTEGTDQAAAEKNLRQEYENVKKDQQVKKEFEGYEKSKAKGMRQGGYVKAADGCAQRGKTRGKMV